MHPDFGFRIAASVLFLLFPFLVRFPLAPRERAKSWFSWIFVPVYTFVGLFLFAFRMIFPAIDDWVNLTPFLVVPVAVCFAMRWCFLGRRAYISLVFTSFSLSFMFAFFAVLPESAVLEFPNREKQRWEVIDAIVGQPELRTLAHISRIDGDPYVEYENGDRVPMVATHPSRNESYDPYQLWCNDAGTELLVSFEDREQIERFDLATGAHDALFTHGGTTYFTVSPDGETGVSGHRWYKQAPYWMFEFDIESMQIERRIDFPGGEHGRHSPFDVFRVAQWIDPERMLVHSMGGRIYIVDRDYNILDRNWFPSAINSGLYVPRHHYYYSTEAPLLVQFEVPSLRVTNVKFLKTDMWVEYFEKHDDLLANGLFDMHVLDPVTLRTKRTFPIGSGVRMFSIDPNRELVFVAKYYPGSVSVVDYKTGETIGSIDTGTYTRCVLYCAGNDKVYVGSEIGIFEFDPSLFEAESPP